MPTRWAAADTKAELTVPLDETKAFDKIVIFEYCDSETMEDGFSNKRINRIRSYCIDAWLNGTWETIYVSDVPMGDCKVIRFPQAYRSSKIRLKVLDASLPLSIYELNVVNSGEK